MPKISKMTGVLCRNVKDTETLIETGNVALSSGFEFFCMSPIFQSEYISKILESQEPEKSVHELFAWDDLRISGWSNKIVVMLNDLDKEMQSDNPMLANSAKILVERQINFVRHLGLPAVVIDLKSNNSVNLARIVQSSAAFGSVNFWIRIPLKFEDSTNETTPKSPWNLWNDFRTHCNHEYRIWPALEITPDLPDEEDIQRWLGEPVKSILVSKACFVSNPHGSPVLQRTHQLVVRKFLELGAQLIFDPQLLGQPFSIDKLAPYKQYIDFLKSTDFSDQLADQYGGTQFTHGYEDYLQCPLQPLQDNLESHTYEVFEKDPVKYDLYGQAVYDALFDMIPDSEKATKRVVLMVVGAGRGPIVSAAIKAAKDAARLVKFYAIEKNINAANTLFHLNKTTWDNQVTIVNTDMREWKAPEKADILVSELLGSFSDNELSPECLDGAQIFLKPGGIMIPQSYTSYICPIMSSKLYNEARKIRDPSKNCYHNFETPYVVHMKNRYVIANPQKVFTFSHPKENSATTNDRSAKLKFSSKEDCVLHGFAGYFESTLYKTTLMSILPSTFSEGMFSWFPIYFPIREPVTIKKGEDITAHIWRCSSKTSVWYEWTISSPRSIPIHNPNGRSYTIGL